MIEEINALGVYMPAALGWCVVAVILTYLLRGLIHRLPVHVVLWHPALLDLACFILIWWGLGALADIFLRK